jgi:hypothetical protein
VRRFVGGFSLDFFEGIIGGCLCILVDDLDHSNAGNQAQFGEVWMNSSWCFKCTRFAVLVDGIGLGLQDFGHSFS